jgi:hypothetical protein
MQKKDCKAALDVYKRFVTRMDRVQDFLKTAEDVGFDKEDIPDLSKVCLYIYCTIMYFCMSIPAQYEYMAWPFVLLCRINFLDCSMSST